MDSYKIDVTEMSEQDKVRVQKAAFKLGYVWSHSKDNVINLQAGYYYLGRDGLLGWDWASSGYHFDKDYGRQITLQQLLKLAGMEGNMTTKQFSKKDLKTGMILVFNNGEYATVLLGTANGDIVTGDTWFLLKDYEDGQLFNAKEVRRVLQPKSNRHFNLTLAKKDPHWTEYEVVWEYKEKSATQIELEKLQKQIADLQAQANKLQSTL